MPEKTVQRRIEVMGVPVEFVGHGPPADWLVADTVADIENRFREQPHRSYGITVYYVEDSPLPSQPAGDPPESLMSREAREDF